MRPEWMNAQKRNAVPSFSQYFMLELLPDLFTKENTVPQDILIIGTSRQEQRLLWQLAQCRAQKDPHIGQLYNWPGNAQIAHVAEVITLPRGYDQLLALSWTAQERQIGLTVVCPGHPLAESLINIFRWRKLRIFGPVPNGVKTGFPTACLLQLMRNPPPNV